MKSTLCTFFLLFFTFQSLKAFDHSVFDQLLRKHVSAEGQVNYKGFIADHSQLNAYLQQIKNATKINSWSQQEQLAFYINAYNAFTIQLIVQHYPIKSINDIAQPWDQKFFSIEGRPLSLNQLEHEILRKKFKEPRIHFAIVCASFSCPQLLNEAFLPEKLNEQLTKQTKTFLSDAKRNVITEKKAEISEIFSWFKDDFTQNGTLIDFINQYSSAKLTSKTKIKYLPYNWSLNE